MSAFSSAHWVIVVRDRSGFWSPQALRRNDVGTRFRSAVPAHPTAEAAEAHRAELIGVGWQADQLRVVQYLGSDIVVEVQS